MSSEYVSPENDSTMLDFFSHGVNMMILNGRLLHVTDFTMTMHGNVDTLSSDSYFSRTAVSIQKPNHLSVKFQTDTDIRARETLGSISTVILFNDKHYVTFIDAAITDHTKFAYPEHTTTEVQFGATDFVARTEWKDAYRSECCND